MRLGVSWEAAPQLSAAELVQLAAQRGLAAVELGPDVVLRRPGAGLSELDDLCSERGDDAVTVAAIAAPPNLDDAGRIIAACSWLQVPAIVSAADLDDTHLAFLIERAAALDAHLLLRHGSDPDAIYAISCLIDETAPRAARLAWQIDPAAADVARRAESLDAARHRLGYVRLRGGGPEAHQQTGLGIGELMMTLTLARFAGPLVLTPSNPAYHQAWKSWLGRGGGWGCGSKQSDPLPLLKIESKPEPVTS